MQIYNIALFSQSGAGKTTLLEAILYEVGEIKTKGEVEKGNTVSDYQPEEIERKTSISLSIAPVSINNKKINIIDTPGYLDFIGEVYSVSSAIDAAIILISAKDGIGVGTEKVFENVNKFNIPHLVFINSLDIAEAQYFNILQSLKENFDANYAIINLPQFKDGKLHNVTNLIRPENIEQDMKEKVTEYNEKLKEAVAEVSDELMEKYLEGKDLTEEDIKKGLKLGIKNNQLIPTLCGSAKENIGIKELLNFITEFVPPSQGKEVIGINSKTSSEIKRKINDEGPFSGFVFKTMADPYIGRITFLKILTGKLSTNSIVYNPNKNKEEKVGKLYLMCGKNKKEVDTVSAGDIIILTKLTHTLTDDTLCDKSAEITYPETEYPQPVYQLAVEPKTKGDEEKMSTCLQALAEEDKTFRIYRDYDIKQTIIQGMGELHLEVILDKLKRKYNVEVTTKLPKVPYRETIKKKVKAQGKYKRQSGGRGQYGDVHLEIEPKERGSGFEFTEKIFGGAIPKNYIPAVEKGVREALKKGDVAGYPVVDIKVTLYDGSYHEVDSSDIAFQIAASMGMRNAFSQADPTLLEPIMDLVVYTPPEFMGDILGDLNARRGRILGSELKGNKQIIKAKVPYQELLKYAIELKSMTQARATFTMQFSHYEEIPAFLKDKIIERAKKQQEE